MTQSWNAPQWVRNSIFYQIFPERFHNGDPSNDPPGTVPWDSEPTRDNFFGGDLAGITQKLDYLEKLGINTLYLTPFFVAQTNHRYDTSDYRQVDPAAGTLEDFRNLINASHSRKIRVILDAVFNHCGDGFWAFQDVVQRGSSSEYADWFTVRSYPISDNPPTYQTCGGAAFLPKLNHTNPLVRDYLLDTARYWLEQGADGWRLDVPWKVPLDFWREFRQTVLQTKPDAYIVAEVWRGTREWLQADTVHGVMNYQLRNAILDFCAWDHMDAEDFDYELRQIRQEHGATAPFHLTLLGSHDTPRILSICDGNVDRARLAAIFQFTYIGTPMVYYGDEIGMEGGNDPLCRSGMVWDAQQWNHTLLDTYRRLIDLRLNHTALTEGEFEALLVFNGVYAFHRYSKDDHIIVVLNPRDTQTEIRVPMGSASCIGSTWIDALSNTRIVPDAGHLVIEKLPAQSGMVLIPEKEVHA